MPNPDKVTVAVAQHAGGDELQDVVVQTDHALAVLDGASGSHMSGGWYARTLGAELRTHLEQRPNDPLTEIVADSVRSVAAEHQLTDPQSPSSTVAIVRWTDQLVEGFALGDSPILVVRPDGSTDVLHDDRLGGVAANERQAYRQRLTTGAGYNDEHRHLITQLITAERRARNQPNGYWIASANPEAAQHALTSKWSPSSLASAVLLSDGAAVLLTRYRRVRNWADLARHALASPASVIAAVRSCESLDPTGQFWPRSKPNDDATCAVLFRRLPSR